LSNMTLDQWSTNPDSPVVFRFIPHKAITLKLLGLQRSANIGIRSLIAVRSIEVDDSGCCQFATPGHSRS